MQNLIKALNYQTRRDNFTIYAVLAGAAMSAISLLDLLSDDMINVCGGVYAAYNGSNGTVMMGIGIMLAILVSRICGWDMSDKTINYEVMSGHSRAKVYFSRVIVSVQWAVALSFLLLAVPTAIVTLMNGWGKETDMGGIAARYLLMLLPVLRLTSLMVMLTFVAGSFAAGAVLGYIISEVGIMIPMILEEFLDMKFSFELASANMTKLLTLNSRLGYVDGRDMTVYDSAVSAELVLGTVLVSLAVSAVYIFIGYRVFMKRDMK